ncbi:MAG TPA: carboxypeptidase-like regulatory domain-containing protein, partial [Planctomycetaceae bacterium]|nr:carboxypeptidase-like regulatory domain-containing protein [Planctomycetaceae bacterium]
MGKSHVAYVEILKDGYRAARTRSLNREAVALAALESRRVTYVSYILERDDESSNVPDSPRAVERPRPGSPKMATVTGRIVDSRGEGLQDVRVVVAVPATDLRSIHPASGHVTYQTTSGAEGRYEILVPLNGQSTLSVNAMKPGFRSGYGALRAGDDVRDVAASPGSTPSASFLLEPALNIAGVVIDERGAPVALVSIKAISRG